MVSPWWSRTAGQDGGTLQSCADTQEPVAGHRGRPWATEGFPLPVHPGLMSRQVLLQMQSYSWLKTGHAPEGCSGTEHSGTGGKPCLCHSIRALTLQTVLFPCNISGGRGANGPALVLDVRGRGRAKAGMPDTAEPAGCPSTAAAAVTAWVSRTEMQPLKCLPSTPGRGWHPAKAAPPIQQPKRLLLPLPTRGQLCKEHIRIPYQERGNLVLWKSLAVAGLKSLALTCHSCFLMQGNRTSRICLWKHHF